MNFTGKDTLELGFYENVKRWDIVYLVNGGKLPKNGGIIQYVKGSRPIVSLIKFTKETGFIA